MGISYKINFINLEIYIKFLYFELIILYFELDVI